MKFLLPVSVVRLFPRNLKIFFYPAHSPAPSTRYSGQQLHVEKTFSTSVSFGGLREFSIFLTLFTLNYFIILIFHFIDAEPKVLLVLK